jgi:MerR family transcriptional regulator, light-induced transcriptional regulator
VVDDSFTPKQIALALRVSESSVKRWCDRGDIRTDRTVGGHRRIPLGFLLEFLESTNRRIVDPMAIGLEKSGAERIRPALRKPLASELIMQFEKSLLDGDESKCRRIFSSWYSNNDGFASLADDLICPVFRAIGRGWQEGTVDMYQERRGCEITVRLILELRRLVAEPDGTAPLAMGGTPSGDRYQLPTLATETVFREQGWRTANLGADIPFSSLLSAARKHMPKLFWVSVSYVADEDQFLSEYAHFASRLPKGIILLVGGRALTDGLRPKMVYSAHCDGMRQLAVLARTLKNGPLTV